MRQLLLPEDLGNAIIFFLQKHPYEQVHRLISGIVGLQEAGLAEDKKEPEKKLTSTDEIEKQLKKDDIIKKGQSKSDNLSPSKK
jgi:hypothetical protein